MTVRDALIHFPRDYQDRRQFVPLPQAPARRHGRGAGNRLRRGPPPTPRLPGAPVQVTFRDQTGFSPLSGSDAALSRPAVFKRDQRVVLYGKKALAKDRRDRAREPRVRAGRGRRAGLDSHGAARAGLSASPRVSSRSRCGSSSTVSSRPTPSTRPTSCRRSSAGVAGLIPVAEAYRAVHFPGTLEDVEAARRRFAFEDFFVLQVGLAIKRRRQAREHGRPLAPPGDLVARLLRELPFALTPAQERVWSEIRSDLAAPGTHEPAAPGGCRLRQDDRRRDGPPDGRGSGLPGGAHGAHRDPRRAALPDAARARRAARAHRGVALRRPAEPGAPGGPGSAPQRRRGHRRRHPRPHPGGGGASSASGSPSSTSSTASACSSARRSAGRASTRTCWS